MPALPAELPVMVLRECYHFPGTMLPLYIFEQRYREMLAYSLSTTRMFCIGLPARPRDDSELPELYPYATAAVINACVKQSDGTSQLVLMGAKRVRFTGWVQDAPFRMAKIEPVESILETDGKVEAAQGLCFRLLDEIVPPGEAQLHEVLRQLREADDPELTCDVLTYHFVRRSSVLRASLAETSVLKRFAALLMQLELMKGTSRTTK
jgi:Lon protease-like protein